MPACHHTPPPACRANACNYISITVFCLTTWQWHVCVTCHTTLCNTCTHLVCPCPLYYTFHFYHHCVLYTAGPRQGGLHTPQSGEHCCCSPACCTQPTTIYKFTFIPTGGGHAPTRGDASHHALALLSAMELYAMCCSGGRTQHSVPPATPGGVPEQPACSPNMPPAHHAPNLPPCLPACRYAPTITGTAAVVCLGGGKR